MERKPYTYLIGWSKLDCWYYGSKTGKQAHPSKFWVNYHTSSAKVKKLRKMHGEPDVIQVRRTFNDDVSALRWEMKFIARCKMIYSDKWLNSSPGGCLEYVKAYTQSGKEIVTLRNDPKFDTGEIVHYNKGFSVFVDENGNTIRCTTEEASRKGYADFTKNKQTGKDNPFYGKTHSEDSLARMRGPRPNYTPANKGKKMNYGPKWYEKIRAIERSGEKNSAFGSSWYGHPTELLKCYVKSGDSILESRLKNAGWIKKPKNFAIRKSVTKNIKEYLL